MVWKFELGVFSVFLNLWVIFNFGVGVDVLMVDKSLFNVLLVCVVVFDFMGCMIEYVVLYVLMYYW